MLSIKLRHAINRLILKMLQYAYFSDLMKSVKYCICSLCSCWSYHRVSGSHFAHHGISLVCSLLVYPGYNLAIVLSAKFYRITEHLVQYGLQPARGIVRTP